MNFTRFIPVFLLCFFYSVTSPAQYRNLVFEGAGIRGIAYSGALEVLDEHHLLDSIRNVGGTSAGAIMATALALGYTPAEISRINSEADYAKFNDSPFWFIGGIRRLFKTYGWYRGKSFDKWMGGIIEAKTGNADITFSELNKLGGPALHVTGISLNNQKLLIFSAENYPEMKVRDAVLISVSVPYYFQAVPIDSKGHRVKKPKGRDDIDYAVDGGITACYPVFLFDKIDSSGFRMIRVADTTTLGIRIDKPEQVENDKYDKGLAPVKVKGFGSYSNAFYTYIFENLNRNFLTPGDWQRTISISDGNISPKITELSQAQKDLLINNGKAAAEEFLKGLHRETLPDSVTTETK